MNSSDPRLPKRRSFEDLRDEIEDEIERSYGLNYNQKKALQFVKKLYEFVSSENDFCEIASTGGIVFKSEDRLKKFQESFRNKDKASLRLARTFKAFRDKLHLYNFHNKFKDPTYYRNSNFTKDKPRLKLIAIRKKDRRELHSKEVKLDRAEREQRIREIDDQLDDLWKQVQSLKASNAQLKKEQELEDNLPESDSE